jgi:TPP-dependent pyruvate/acetoin dehydrogenase alpha subunit
MITKLKEDDLISFEEDIAQCFNDGRIRAPIHLYHGNEKEIISIFQNIKKEDYIFCGWRSHYQCLLKGVPPNVLKKDILNHKSITLCYPEHNIFSSAIVTGSVPMANGRAFAEKLKKSGAHVWCFVGDMTSETGSFHENLKYSISHDLPITWVIEDNNKSVCTDTKETWKLQTLTHENSTSRDNFVMDYNGCPKIYELNQWNSLASQAKPLSNHKIIYYKYESKYPHAGAGERVQF